MNGSRVFPNDQNRKVMNERKVIEAFWWTIPECSRRIIIEGYWMVWMGCSRKMWTKSRWTIPECSLRIPMEFSRRITMDNSRMLYKDFDRVIPEFYKRISRQVLEESQRMIPDCNVCNLYTTFGSICCCFFFTMFHCFLFSCSLFSSVVTPF